MSVIDFDKYNQLLNKNYERKLGKVVKVVGLTIESIGPSANLNDLCVITSQDKTQKIMALGEIGLDYYYDLSERDVQREVFEKQLELAYEYDIPIILHEREATGDCLEILKRFYKEGRLRKLPGVCHCCSCSLEASRELLKMGFYLGFDGPLTFKNNKKTPEVVYNTPWDRIVIETDSPYLTPEPNRGLTNEPAHVAFVCSKLAEVKGVSIEEAAQITYDNGKILYGVD